jgi:hypothetical protein
MRKKSRFLAVVMAVTLLAGITITTVPSVGADLGGILKGAGLVYLVDRFGEQLNDFVNKVTFNKGVGVEDRTKVVPIISIGQGAYAGAAQVSGPAAQIDKVKAVAQIETNMAGKTFRIKALVPVESKDIVKDLKRVSGVGVSAMIDVRL